MNLMAAEYRSTVQYFVWLETELTKIEKEKEAKQKRKAKTEEMKQELSLRKDICTIFLRFVNSRKEMIDIHVAFVDY